MPAKCTLETLKRDAWWWGSAGQKVEGGDKEGARFYNPKNYAEVFHLQFPELDPNNPEDEAFARVIFRAHFSECAWLYEGFRRIDATNRPPFPALCLEQMQKLAKEWRAPGQVVVVYIHPKLVASATPGDGWTRLLTASYNLRANNTALEREFRKFIDSERRRLGFIDVQPNAGVRRKPRSWTPWETWDRREILEENVTVSEEKTLKRATSSVAKCKARMELLLSD